MTILGIDPGLATMGYGVLRAEGGRFSFVDCGVILTPAGMALPERLRLIYDGTAALFDEYKPDAVAAEELFFTKNITTGIAVAQARGVAMLACVQRTDKLYEFTPMQVKRAVAGYGKATKAQMMQMVKSIFGLPEPPRPDDAADAIAVAVCCAQAHGKLQEYFRIR